VKHLPRILVLGAGGQLGAELARQFANAGHVIALGHQDLDLADESSLRARIRQSAADVILNAAAYTAVDRAESEPELAMAINASAPQILAEECAATGALLVHYSTDYVFDGTKSVPWSEDDSTNPLNIYGRSKLAGENGIRQAGRRFLIFRTSWVYGPTGKNFLRTMLRLGQERDVLSVVDDQTGAPTTTLELARSTRLIVDGIWRGEFGEDAQWSGLYHMTCAGSASWYQFAQAIFSKISCTLQRGAPKVQPISTSAYPTPALRPANSVLSNEKLWRRFGVRLAGWEDALEEVIRTMPHGTH
jgi:dTDP-4-dehydrorhamnose reductase